MLRTDPLEMDPLAHSPSHKPTYLPPNAIYYSNFNFTDNPTKHSQGFKKSKIIKKVHLLSKILCILLHEAEKNEADKLDPNAFKIEREQIHLY